MDSVTADNRGSIWRRWDPHIHTPDTILNNQFGGTDSWDLYITKVEETKPPIEVLGITEYYALDAYKAACQYKASGRLAAVPLIFPNVEMRLALGTGKGTPVNVHLLISPDDPDHVDEAERFLASLTFEAFGEVYRCTRPDLTRLGRKHNPTNTDDASALRTGVNQFKVGFDNFRHEMRRSSWARENMLVAVAAGSSDGTSGLKADSSLATLRREVERFATVIFSSQPKQRDFWLGRGSVSVKDLQENWNGLKPCLHGSDAHDLDAVGVPALNRYTWIKGDPTFESLRQACIEPDLRAYVGTAPPGGALPYKVMAEIAIPTAEWCQTSPIPLNSGLIGIIGARGSGKTALADIIAATALSKPSDFNAGSFLHRAAPHLIGTHAELNWGDGEKTKCDLGNFGDQTDESPRVQYLSQQFVEELCSSDGIADALVAQIERVVYLANSSADRLGTSTFQELLDLRTSRARGLRDQAEEAIQEAGNALTAERELHGGLPGLQELRGQIDQTLTADRAAVAKLTVTGGPERAERLRRLDEAVQRKRMDLDALRRKRKAVSDLSDSVSILRTSQIPGKLADLQQRHRESSLTDAEWQAFKLDFVGDVDSILADHLARSSATVDALLVKSTDRFDGKPEDAPPYLSDIQDLSLAPLDALELESERLKALIGLDDRKLDALSKLTDRISTNGIQMVQLDERIAHANGAVERISGINESRKTNYLTVFDAIVDEEAQLRSLYEPLKTILNGQDGALGKLSFSVRRIVDVEAWAKAGELLLDLRRAGPFRGHGALYEAARSELLWAWKSGTSTEVAQAMTDFRVKYDSALLEHAPVLRTNRGEYFRWGTRVAAWLTDTSHISVRYGVQYDGVEIEQLSPGSRGIVLLLLYLSIDQSDDRPLVIDQPEENLDPKSIYDELVGRFKSVRSRRQVVIVTHNANLIVNTDADQVIVAKSGAHRAGTLPQITYTSGGLENSTIRRDVCEILEGGEAAFKERARRLRVKDW